MPRAQVLIIRHAEKPVDGGPQGVDHHGRPSPHGLIPRGWSRAGALAVRLDRAGGPGDPLARPARVFAAATSPAHPSDRSRQTAKPVADRLGVPLHHHLGRGDEEHLAREILASTDDALVVWDHGHIPTLVRAFPLADGVVVPQAWPEDRFDLVWVLSPDDDCYRFSVVAQDVLAGDAPAP